MNLITHDTAYSLYPRATFEERRPLVHHADTIDRAQALTKYKGRGWTVVMKISVEESQDPRSAFSVGMRYLGDRKCWTLPLTPKIDMAAGHMETHTWALSYDSTLKLSMKYMVLLSRKLRFPYLVDHRLRDSIRDLVKEAKSNNKSAIYSNTTSDKLQKLPNLFHRHLDDSLRLLVMNSGRGAFV
jgi:hypothetical protein